MSHVKAAATAARAASSSISATQILQTVFGQVSCLLCMLCTLAMLCTLSVCQIDLHREDKAEAWCKADQTDQMGNLGPCLCDLPCFACCAWLLRRNCQLRLLCAELLDSLHMSVICQTCTDCFEHRTSYRWSSQATLVMLCLLCLLRMSVLHNCTTRCVFVSLHLGSQEQI